MSMRKYDDDDDGDGAIDPVDLVVPFEPEPMHQLQARYAKALTRLWPPSAPAVDRPSHHREHVFDFSDGTRLIVSRHVLTDGEISVHVQARATYERMVGEARAQAMTGEYKVDPQAPVKKFWELRGGVQSVFMVPAEEDADGVVRLVRWFAPVLH